MNESAKVLMIEDSASLAEVYKAYLSDTDYQLVTVETLGRAHATLGAFRPDIVLLDIELPDGNGMDFLADLQGQEDAPKVIVMTAHGTSDMAVKAIQLGAFDFLTKPFDAARLRVTLDNAASQLRLGKRVTQLASLERESYGSFIGKSLAMQSVYKTIDSLASSDATGFIVGESGTGKELIEKAIHYTSTRSEKPFVTVNVAAITETILESELFGYDKGAFTGANTKHDGLFKAADGGTMFLDEIGDMALPTQTKILRALQEGEIQRVGGEKTIKVDVRLIAATNRDLEKMVEDKSFREDLYYRLYGLQIELPSLKDRGNDVLILAKHFIDAFCDD